MPSGSVFQVIADEFDRLSIPCVLVGGWALHHHGVSRQTADIDLLIEERHYPAASQALAKAGYREFHRTPNFSRLRPGSVYLMDVDFLFVDAKTFDAIRSEGKTVDVDSRPFTVPSLRHLIALKLHAIKYNPRQREAKDLLDIVGLIQANGMAVDTQEFRDLCLQYGTEDVLKKIRSLVGGA